MANVIGTVKQASGLVRAQRADGEFVTLNVGDSIEENDVVQTVGSDSSLVLEFEDGHQLTLGASEEVLVDQSVFAAAEEGDSVDVEALQAALLEGADLEETAAGVQALGDSVHGGAPYEERGDARGNVDASLRPTSFGQDGSEEGLRGAEFVPSGEEGEGPETIDENTAPVAVDDSSETDVSKYTIDLGGENGWDDVSITAYVNYLGEDKVEGDVDINPGNGKLGVLDADGNSMQIIDNFKGEEEALEFTFNGFLNHVEVSLESFNTSNSNNERTNNDAAIWKVLIGDTVVDSGVFTSDGPNPTMVIDTGDLIFDTLIVGTPDSEDGHDDFFVESISGSGPFVAESSLTVIENSELYIPETELIANDQDAEGDALNIIDINTSATIGEVSMDADGNVTYDPSGRFDHLNPGEYTTDTFEYTVSDGELTDTATVTVNIVGTGSAADGTYNASTGEIDGGAGYDTIVVDSDEAIDFSNLSNIEHVDLQGGGHSLSISAEDIFNASDSDNYIRISGENSDTLTLTDFSFDTNADGYNAYTGSFAGEEVTLHIDTDISVDVIP